MSEIKVTVDNNFFDQNLLQQPRLLEYFENGKVLFYPSLELIGEFLCMHGKQDKEEALRRYSAAFLQMGGKVILASWRDLVLNDVGIMQSQPYLDKRLEYSLGKVFYKIANDKILDKVEENLVEKIKATIDDGKDRMGIKYIEAKKLYSTNGSYRDFEDFYNREGSLIQKTIVKKIFQSNQKSVEENDVIKIIDSLDKRPYLNLYLRIYGAFVFYHYIDSQKNQRVEGNDFYDHLYLVYLADVDYLITDDRKLAQLAALVFPNQDRVIKRGDLQQLS